MESQRLQELAALQAIGALDGEDAQEFQKLLASGDAFLDQENAAFARVATALAEVLPIQQPSSALRSKILDSIARLTHTKSESPTEAPSPSIEAGAGFRLIRESESGWKNLKVRGASVKLLSLDRARGYAVVLGKLEPGTRYPAHIHSGPEEVYVLSGDLHIEGRVLHAGDFHHADAGTSHGDNFSEHGCTILAILSAQDLVAQM